MNGQLFLEYEYLPSGRLKSYTVWNYTDQDSLLAKHGLITSFLYDVSGIKIEERKSLIIKEEDKDKICPLDSASLISYRAICQKNTDSTQISKASYSSLPQQFFYNKKGKLVCLKNPDSCERFYAYSKAGRIIREWDNKGRIIEYSYSADGGCKKILKINGNRMAFYEYDECGNLILFKDFAGNCIKWKYDSSGKMLLEESPDRSVEYFYDLAGRLVKNQIRDKNGKKNFFTQIINKNGEIIKYRGDYIAENYKCDCWDRILEYKSAVCQEKYFYNPLGQLIKKEDGNGLVITYEYNALGKASLIKDNENNILQINYRLDGQKSKITRKGETLIEYEYEKDRLSTCHLQNGLERNYTFDDLGIISELSRSECGKRRYSYNHNSYTIEDENHKSWKRIYNSNLELEKEINPLGKERKFFYDENGNLKREISFGGKNIFYDYDSGENSLLINDDSGAKSLIQRNELGSIKRLENPITALSYKYNSAGLIEEQKDLKADFKLLYSYDTFGRLIKKESELFSFIYQYDNQGNIKEIREELSASWVKISRDKYGREGLLEYSNGIKIQKNYSSSGLINYILVKDKINQLLWADYLLYDNNNRVKVRCNHLGELKKYFYDQQGRFISCLENYSQPLYDSALTELKFCGGFESTDLPPEEKLTLSDAEYSALQNLVKVSGLKLFIPQFQPSWKREFSYTSTGSVREEKNPLGTIVYEYDALNRLLQKHSSKTKSKGIFYKWSDDNYLEEEACDYYKKTYKYKNNPRPEEILFENYEDGSLEKIEYEYDALGRRYKETINGENQFIYLYEGLSLNLLAKIPVFKNGRKNTYFSISSEEDSELYRLMKLPYLEITSCHVFLCEGKNILASIRPDERGNLSSGQGNQNITSQGNQNITFYAHNYKKDLLVSLNNSGEIIEYFDDSLWSSSQDFGYRDYSEEMKAFTSMDPSYDGGNYFSYCLCDPVNNIDEEGFKKTTLTQAELSDFYSHLGEYLTFDQGEFKEIGGYNGLPESFDCADVSAYLNFMCMKEAGVDFGTMSSLLAQFGKLFLEGKYQEAKNLINSANFFNESYRDFVTLLFYGYDRDLLTYHDELKGSDEYTSNQLKREFAKSFLENPNFITPGTVLVWKKSEYQKSDTNWVGHTLTVMARKIDFSTGKILGFAYLEGHQNKDTEIGFMNLESMEFNDWIGEFMGAFEMEATEEHCSNLPKEGGCLL
ncbi:MAG: hypothetical protein K6D95_09395 [Treponema sp.]|nr:hypothetical protein [Treponema sp.]